MATADLPDTKDPEVEGPRMVKHTEKGKALFDQQFTNLHYRFCMSCRNIEDIIDSFDAERTADRKYLREMEDRIMNINDSCSLLRIL